MDTIGNILKTIELNDSFQTEQTDEIKKCPYCGKEYEKKELLFLDGAQKKVLQIPACTSDADIEEQKEKERKAEQESINKAIKISKLYEKSLMATKFKKTNFKNLNSDFNTEEIKFCKNYANDFTAETSKGIMMIGNSGTGITTLLACICNELINKEYKCLFTTLTNLIREFTAYSSEHAGSIKDKLRWLMDFDFIVLDDVGRENLTDTRKEIFFQIIDTLYNNEKVVAFTANPEMIFKLKRDNELSAILDRLKCLCPNKFEFKGASLR